MKSEQINEIAAALSKFQGELKGAVKDSANPFFKSKYADLNSVWESARALLAKNGLSVVQTTDVRDVGLVLETTLMHTSGQWISGIYPLITQKQDPQALGSATTYARRYALSAIIGGYATDDDAEAAVDRTPKTEQGLTGSYAAPQAPQEPKKIVQTAALKASPAQVTGLNVIIDKKNIPPEFILGELEKYGASKIADLNRVQYQDVRKAIESYSEVEEMPDWIKNGQ